MKEKKANSLNAIGMPKSKKPWKKLSKKYKEVAQHIEHAQKRCLRRKPGLNVWSATQRKSSFERKWRDFVKSATKKYSYFTTTVSWLTDESREKKRTSGRNWTKWKVWLSKKYNCGDSLWIDSWSKENWPVEQKGETNSDENAQRVVLCQIWSYQKILST